MNLDEAMVKGPHAGPMISQVAIAEKVKSMADVEVPANYRYAELVLSFPPQRTDARDVLYAALLSKASARIGNEEALNVGLTREAFESVLEQLIQQPRVVRYVTFLQSTVPQVVEGHLGPTVFARPIIKAYSLDETGVAASYLI